MKRQFLVLTVAAALGSCTTVYADSLQSAKYQFIANAQLSNKEVYNEALRLESELEASVNAALASKECQIKEAERKERINRKNKDSLEKSICSQNKNALEHATSITEAAELERKRKEEEANRDRLEVPTVVEEEELPVSSVDNDGFAKPAYEVVTKSSFEGSYVDQVGNDVPFYDVQIPYEMTCREVGGIAVDVESKRKAYRFDADLELGGHKIADSKVGTRIVQEWAEPRSKLDYRYSKTIDSCTGSVVYEAGGTTLYGIALPSSMFPAAVGSLGFYTNVNLSQTGVLCDLILTDGTVIHCVVIDGIGAGHSNGIGISNGWTASSVATAQDGVRYQLSTLNYPQYNRFFHAAACHTVELSGSVTGFTKYYGIKSDGSQNKIAYVRIYKASFKEGGFSVKGARASIASK